MANSMIYNEEFYQIDNVNLTLEQLNDNFELSNLKFIDKKTQKTLDVNTLDNDNNTFEIAFSGQIIKFINNKLKKYYNDMKSNFKNLNIEYFDKVKLENFEVGVNDYINYNSQFLIECQSLFFKDLQE